MNPQYKYDDLLLSFFLSGPNRSKNLKDFFTYQLTQHKNMSV